MASSPLSPLSPPPPGLLTRSPTPGHVQPSTENPLVSPVSPTPAPAPAPIREPRKRKVPAKLIDDLDFVSPNKAPVVETARRAPPRTNWSADYLLTNPKSKLGKINLSDLLSNDRAWTALSRHEQSQLAQLLPGVTLPEMPEDEALPNVARACLKSNSSLQADLRLFQEDLLAGRYEVQWLRDAHAASAKRARGDFDAWKEQSREAFWGQKQKIDWSALAGDSSQHDLSTLVAAGYFQVGDTWVLQRGYRPGNGQKQILVEKEAKITDISDSNKLSFAFPPGQAKFSAPAAGDDIVLPGVDGPISLSNAILAEDGRIIGVRGANSWKEFRCLRKNQDMGSLWDIRELYHHRRQD